MSNLSSKVIGAMPGFTDCGGIGGPRVIHVTSNDPNCAVGIRVSPDGTVVGPRFGQGKVFDTDTFPVLNGLPFLAFEVLAGSDKTPLVMLEGPPNPADTMSVVQLAPSPQFTDCSALAPERMILVVSSDQSCVVGIRVSPDGTAVGPRVKTVNDFERDDRPFRWLAGEVLGGSDRTPSVYVVGRPSDLARKTPDGIWFPTGLPANQINGYKTQLYVNDGGAPVVLTGIAVDLPSVVAQDAVNTTTIAAVKYSSATPRVAGATLSSLSNTAAALAASQDNLFTAQVQNPIINPGEAVYLQMTAAGTGTALPAGTHVRALF